MVPKALSGTWLISITVGQDVQVRFAVHPAGLPDHLALPGRGEVER